MFQLLILVLFVNACYCEQRKDVKGSCWPCTADPDTCVKRTKLCDGNPDCPDSSDETAYCHLLTPNCPLPAFRCTYGACIRGTARCDGLLDCADGSDERNCTLTVSTSITTVAPCRPLAREMCDGWPHCEDGSDETVELCGNRPSCPPKTYRCAYGACVHANARCNGLRDCADDSDELECQTKFEEDKDSCLMPTVLPLHARVFEIKHAEHTWLVYRCDTGYVLNVRGKHVCLANKWTPPLPTSNHNICKRVRQRSSWSWFF